ncbi:MAG: ShlB/FhaC/HecB family hemolysin secretion/activation protein [Verrucomicrobia bacterium]|nr:ShlB/FhaC/HecB family hemolysin secretion/activation protein [Verrucomicrobiota bacterium]
MRNVLLTCSVLCGALYAKEDVTYYVPKTQHKELFAKASPPSKYTETLREKRVLLPELKGIVISGDPGVPPPYVLQSVKGVDFYRMKISVGGRDRLKRELNTFAVGKPLTEQGLKQIKCRVAEYYRKRGESLVHVYIPEQEIKDGVIVVNVIEACLGKVNITGNCWFSEDLYMNAINLRPDQAISAKQIEEDVSWLNRSPWRKVCVVYKPGEKFGSTDVEIVVRDERPFRVYVGADNTGFKLTDYARLFVGFNWGNFLGLDQVIGYQYTASPDFEKFQGHMIHYTVPFTWRHLFLAYGGVSYIKGIHDDLPANVQHGVSWQFSSRYVIPLPEANYWKQDTRFGFDWKRTNNDFIVGEDTASTSMATIFQGVLSYEGSSNSSEHSFAAKVDFYFQPWHVGDGMSQTSYDSLRPGAQNMYCYLRATGDYTWTYPYSRWGSMFSTIVTAQVASGALIPLEQLGLGGFNSVRGYVDRAVNVDDGILINLELRSPKWSVFNTQKNTRLCGLGCDAFSALVFLDAAYGALVKTSPGQPSNYFLAGVGPGLRYDFGTWMRARFDMAFPLIDAPWGSPHTGFVQFYFSVILSY